MLSLTERIAKALEVVLSPKAAYAAAEAVRDELDRWVAEQERPHLRLVDDANETA